MSLQKKWINNPTPELLNELISNIDFVEVLEAITNEYNGADRLDFFIGSDDEIYFIETYTNTSHNLDGYIGRLFCDKGDYKYLWEGYAYYDEETDLWITEEGEKLTRKELRNLCLEDCIGYELEENLKENLYHNGSQNLI